MDIGATANADNTGSNDSEFGYVSLQAVRKKLLDLSGRNQLLNYKHPKATCVRIIDEHPNQIFDELRNGKTFTFIPVPDPTISQLLEEGYLRHDEEGKLVEAKPHPSAEKWASYLGFNTEYELPRAMAESNSDAKYSDLNIQTLMYATELEAKLRNIRGRSETAIEECGSNILYLVLGFLEWYESRDSEVKRFAPLFTLPVRLERAQLDRDQSVFRYVISAKDEGLLTNITLKEKLANDFDLVLPDIDEETMPEAYFDQISNVMLKHQPRWKIHRMATLAMLNFAKQVMYEDLDPKNWPEHNRIEDHPIIKLFFASQQNREEKQAVGFVEEFRIDEIPEVHTRFPLIYDADSSQHSALIDAANGESLVIEGPPGSGKSQTITNLIAACIANGKRVLFVAEKMAALEVVKNRLDRAGLGDFCLELHSHKTEKRRLLEGLKGRLDRQGKYPDPKEIDADIQRFEDLKEKLNRYVDAINSQWKGTGLTVHEILNAATRLREQLRFDPDYIHIKNATGELLSSVRRRELSDYAQMLVNIFQQVQEQAKEGVISNHHWYGVNNADLYGHQHAELHLRLNAWNQILASIQQSLHGLLGRYQVEADNLAAIDDVRIFVIEGSQLPDLLGGEPLQLITKFVESSEDFNAILDVYERLHQEMLGLQKIFKATTVVDKGAPETLWSSLAALRKLGVLDTESVDQLHHDFSRMKEVDQKARSISEQLTLIAQSVPESLKVLSQGTYSSLNELKTFIYHLNQLPVDLWKHRDSVYDAPEMDAILEQMTGRFSQLVPLNAELKEHFKLNELPSSQLLKDARDILHDPGLFAFLSKRWWAARKTVLALAQSIKPNKKELWSLLPKLINYKAGMEEVDKINAVDQALGSLYQGIDTPLDRIVKLRAWYRTVRAEYGRGLVARAKVGEQLFVLDRDLVLSIADLDRNGLTATINSILDLVQDLRSRFSKFSPILNDALTYTANNSPLQLLMIEVYKPLKAVLASLNQEHVNLFELNDAVSNLEKHQNAASNWTRHSLVQTIAPDVLPLSITPGSYNKTALDIARNWSIIIKVCRKSNSLYSILSRHASITDYERLRNECRSLASPLNREREGWDLFSILGKVNESEWNYSSQNNIELLIQRNARALDNQNWLNTWLDYIRLRRKLTNEGMDQVLAKLESAELQPGLLCDVVHLILMHQLSMEVLSEQPYLAEFTGLEQAAIRERFCDYDKKLMKLQREKIAHRASRSQPPAGNASGKVGSYTETALIMHESGKKTRHIAVRNLVERAGRAIQALKPCFMMSPMSVAQYIAPGDFEFDIVVMDEASQIRPEDALGAIARGKSLVVVGDPKQLPPTSFFDKVADDEFDEDTVALQESESILESAIPMFKTRRLRWHYRSRHESLISFSNLHFYESDLVIFPSPYSAGPEFGIRYHHLKRGRFSRGKNVEEARAIAKSALDHLCNSPGESVGLVAMNAEQRAEIEMHVEQLIKEDPRYKLALDQNTQSVEPLFIKNLENVQGDERDVIMISMTYGPDEVGGKVYQRFGPINKDVGWRRLNVLFTRSKKRMHIYSSMSSYDIQISGTSKKGVHALKNFLEYCESGHLYSARETGRKADSDFEIAVKEALSNNGYECSPQLGVAGYYLDLAVKDPGNPSRFLMGIECDGATYHSAKSARDRDRLRQEILESLGWKIRRIWSTDWFKNPEAQLQPLLNELAKMKTSMAIEIESHNTVMQGIPNDEIDASDVVRSFESGQIEAGLGSSGKLRERLVEFDEKVIRQRFPGARPDTSLLRPAMLEALLHHLPTSKEEFAFEIPGYLRSGTDPAEAKAFLDAVLEIISDYG